MKQTSFPVLSEITLDSIAENCKYEFGIHKGDFEQSVFNAGGWLSRIRRGKSKINDFYFQKMFNLIKANSDSFVTTMKSWYPSLSGCTTETDIIEIVKANLAGIASVTSQASISSSLNINSKQFLNECLQYSSSIECIKMAAQTGWRWFDDHERTDLLIQLAQNNIKIQVIGNPTSSTMKKIARAMRDSSKELRYMGLNRTLAKWHDYEMTYPSIQFRVSDYPILRQTLIVIFKDKSSRALIRDYAYGSPVESSAPHKQVSCTDPDYRYYYDEFEFLWDNSQTYEQWYETLPRSEETMQPGNYILMYPSHDRISEHDSRWIYSALSITDKNTAALSVNITDSLDSFAEYTYQGDLRLTRNCIFITLHDDDHQEEINISLVRPLHTQKDRFIGIITGLSPSGQQPLAFKCACVGRSLLSKINYNALNQLLSHNNKEWDDNLLVLENPDINMFYSDHIFYEKSR